MMFPSRSPTPESGSEIVPEPAPQHTHTHGSQTPTPTPAPMPMAITYRPCGRAHSPPTWAWYEQVHPGLEDMDECDEDGVSVSVSGSESGSDSDSGEGEEAGWTSRLKDGKPEEDLEMDVVAPLESEKKVVDSANPDGADTKEETTLTSEMKGKQKAVDPVPNSLTGNPSPSLSVPGPLLKKHRRRRVIRRPVYNARPILTIKSSQGFVWNQDLFVPSYIKDRYVYSTSPPSHPPMFASSAETLNNYDPVDVVEIRVTGHELEGILS